MLKDSLPVTYCCQILGELIHNSKNKLKSHIFVQLGQIHISFSVFCHSYIVIIVFKCVLICLSHLASLVKKNLLLLKQIHENYRFKPDIKLRHSLQMQNDALIDREGSTLTARGPSLFVSV